MDGQSDQEATRDPQLEHYERFLNARCVTGKGREGFVHGWALLMPELWCVSQAWCIYQHLRPLRTHILHDVGTTDHRAMHVPERSAHRVNCAVV